MNNEWITANKAAKLLGYSQGKIIRDLPIPCYDMTKPTAKIKQYRYKYADVINFMQSRASAAHC